MKKAVLAFSGGLDTSYCVLYLQEQGYEVVTVTVDTGGFTQEELSAIEARALDLGAAAHHTLDGKQALYDQMVGPIIKGNVLRGGVYPLSVGPERVIQAAEVVRIAQEIGAEAVAHGSTGAGNDQVRFDVAVRTLAPKLEIITPIRDQGMTRAEEAAYLQAHGVSVDAEIQAYSVNQGMLGTTIGGKETKQSWGVPPAAVYPTVVPIDAAPDIPAEIVIGFERGLPVSLNGEVLDGPALMARLDALGAQHGVGKVIHLGDTIMGIKGRIALEAPAPLILITAHRELEKLVLTRQQAFWKNHLAEVYGNLLHEGQYFDPVMRDIEALIDSSQIHVTGEAQVKLHKGNILVTGVRSPYSLLDQAVATYGEENVLWDGRDARGFCKIYGVQAMLAHRAAEVHNEDQS
ncbi:MAG: argininosuccinate synthase [Anaerolineae bacterium]